MNKLIAVPQNSNAVHAALLVARVGITALMLTHGLPKLMMLFSGAPVQFPGVWGLSATVSLSLTVFAEVFCSLFIVLGLGTRLAALPISITMLVAIFMIHAADPFSTKELAVLYLLVYVVLLIGGSGKYSLDYLLQSKNQAAGKSRGEVKDPGRLAYQ